MTDAPRPTDTAPTEPATAPSVRHRFPGLSDGWARLDGAAGTLPVDSAIDAFVEFWRSPATSNLGGAFAASAACQDLVDRARTAVGDLVGAEADQIVFGPNSTTLMMGYTRALGRTLQPGDRIVCTQLDHDANVSTWMQMAADRGVHIDLWPLAATGNLDLADLDALLADRPGAGPVRWVAVTGASNLTGAVPPLAGVVERTHAAGARVHLDAVARVPHLPTSHRDLGVDSLMTSVYKWYGPHVGALALSPDLLDHVEPYRVRPADYVGAPRFETGTPAFESLAGVVGAAAFLTETPRAAVIAHEAALLQRLEGGLAALPGVTVHAPSTGDERAPTSIFTVDGHHPDAVAAALATARVAVWHGHSYALELIDALGLTEAGGAVRASIVRYNDESDIDRLLEVVSGLSRP